MLAVFLIVAVLGIWVVYFRHRNHKQVMKLRAQRMGEYAKLDESAFEQETQSSPKVDVTEADRGRFKSDAKQTLLEDLEAQRSRSQSVSQAPSTLVLEEQLPQSRSDSIAPKQLSSSNQQREIFLPPASHSGDHSRSQSLPRPVEDAFEHEEPRYSQTRSGSPSSLVLSRNASMLQPRSSWPSPYAPR